MKIAVAGTGYVGLSLAVLLAQNHEVVALDLIKEKVDFLRAGKSPIHDNEIQDFLDNKPLNLTATLDKQFVNLLVEGAIKKDMPVLLPMRLKLKRFKVL